MMDRVLRRLFALVLGLALAGGSVPCASADEGLYLGWNECRSGSGTANRNYGCTLDFNFESLVLAFQTAVAVDSVIGVEAVVDVQHADPVLPAWWRFGPADCRSSSLTAVADFSSLSECLDPWSGVGSGLIQGFDVGAPFGSPNQCRIKATAFVPSAGAARLDPSKVYYALIVRIDHQKSFGVGACAGCEDGACLVLNSIRLVRLPGAAGGDVLLTTPGPGFANWATWQGGGGASCAAVPTSRSTWGRVKALYR